jgi:hypothetical protein
MRLTTTILLVMLLSVALSSNAFANIKELKIYKEAFPEAKPKCSVCHVDALPKKDDGKHELNEYGKKMEGLGEEPTAEDVKKLGPNEEVK